MNSSSNAPHVVALAKTAGEYSQKEHPSCYWLSDVPEADPSNSSRLTVSLSAETVSAILRQSNLHFESHHLFSAALVSRFWNDCATPILYGEMHVC